MIGAPFWALLLVSALQTPSIPAPDRLTGLLKLPEIFSSEPCEPFEAKRISVYEEASSSARVLGSIEVLNPWKAGDSCPALDVRHQADGRSNPLPSLEFDYEKSAVIVLERRDDWFRIQLDPGSGWIRHESTDDFLPYPDPELLEDKLTYIPQGWDRRLLSAPDPAANTQAIPSAWGEFLSNDVPVRLLGREATADSTWIKVVLDPDAGCGTVPPELEKIEGWIPAYRESRAVSVWFFSRGC